MLTYEYECKACGHQFEARQSINDAALAECPQCKGNVQRLISGGTGFIMKSSSVAHTGQCKSCSFTDTGRTCCGASQRCGMQACGDD